MGQSKNRGSSEQRRQAAEPKQTRKQTNTIGRAMHETPLIIPHPYNPAHTDNLTTIPLLEAQGWRGPDASLQISLFEYGFAWKHLSSPDEDGDDYLIIYRLSGRSFDRCGACSTTDLAKEHDWIRWEEFLSTIGYTREEWDKLPYPLRVYDLVNHYGYENIFGSSYWEGFEITESE